MKPPYSLITLLAASSAPVLLTAQDVYELPDITLSANWWPVSIDETGANVTVVEGEAIESATSTTLGEFLDAIPGVSFTRSGPIGGEASVQIRGARQYDVKVLIDGIEVADPSLTQSYFNFSNMTLGNIDRIEVLRGAQSAVYGGSTSGGVISISTKRPESGLAGSAAMEYGSYNTLSASGSVGYGLDNGFINLSYSRLQSDGFSAAEEEAGNTETDGSETSRIGLSGEYEVTRNFRVGGSVFREVSSNEYDDGFGIPADADNLNDNQSVGARVFGAYETGAFSVELSSQYFSTKRDYTTIYGTGGFEATRRIHELRLGYVVNDWIELNAGLSQTSETASPTGSYGSGENTAEIVSFYAGANIEPIQGLNINLNARRDNHDKFGELDSYRIAAAYGLADAFTFKASWSTGYRAPSFSEAYPPYGNSALSYETTSGYDLGLIYNPNDDLEIGITYFSSEISDRIAWDSTKFAYFNDAGITKRSGVELYGQAEIIEGAIISAGYTYLDTEDPDGNPLAKLAKHEFNLGVNAEIGDKWSLAADLTNARGRIDKNGDEMDDYTVVNARLGYTIGNGEIYARVENLFDTEYQLSTGFGTSDRAYYVGYAIDF